MTVRWRETKWAALAAMLLLAQPALAQKAGPSPEDEAALEEAVRDAEATLEEAERDVQSLTPDPDATPPPPPAPRPQPEPRPAIWLLQDEDTKIYLFGTFHILPPGFRWRSPAIDRVIGEADELVLEISDREMMDDPAAFVEPMMLGKEAPLLWRVSPDRREALAAMVAQTGLPIETFDDMQSWAAVMTMAAVSIVQAYSGEEGEPLTMEDLPGVEDALEIEFTRLERPISGVETVADQIGAFATLSFADQRRMLESMVDAYRGGIAVEDVSELDWVRGNVDAIAIDAAGMPGPLYEALLPRRNRAWTDWLIARLDRPGTVLFAVGAGHLAGPDSVQTMLTARGFTATRID